MKMDLTIKTVEDYLASFPKEAKILRKLRSSVKLACPECEEMISYGICAFKFKKKPLIYFAAYDTHIGVYPGPATIKAFKKEVSKYSFAKGTIRFAADKVNYALVKKMVKFRMNDISKK